MRSWVVAEVMFFSVAQRSHVYDGNTIDIDQLAESTNNTYTDIHG